MEKVIEQFITEKGYKEREDILGIVLYGSTIYNTATTSSDIDLLIITNQEKNSKGLTYIEDKKIEYFERNIYDILKKIEHPRNSLDRSLISIFKNGKTLFSKYNTVENLSEDILLQEKPEKKNRKTTHSIMFTKFYHLLQKIRKDSPLFDYFYYNLLEEIRKEYHEENGYSKLPATKILELYEQEEYAEKYYCVKLPPREFRSRYLTLLTKGYNDCLFQELLTTISKKQEKEASWFQKQKSEIKYESTIVNTSLDKYLSHVKEAKKDQASLYYLTLEKIRNLYCDINGLNRYNIIDNDYEEEFQTRFYTCIKNPKEEAITELFQYVTQPLNINYKEYKVYELKN